MRTGILGGTFNPPHKGHLHAAKRVYEALNLDKVLFIPTNLPPHKIMPEGSATTEQRCEMLKIMLKDEKWAELSTVEIDRGGASYTIDTLSELKRMGKYGDLFLIMGTDMLMMLDKGWREPEKICSLCTLAVVARSLGQQTELEQKAEILRKKLGAKIELIDCEIVEISSTQIRHGENMKKMLDNKVCQYIEQNRLYTQKI